MGMNESVKLEIRVLNMNLLITGTAAGIGQAVAKHFMECGHTVYGIDLIKTESSGHYHGFAADITDESSLQSVKNYLLENNIMLDAILNIAGIHMMASLVESDYARMKKVVDVNFSGTMLVNRVFYDRLAGNGRIIIVTSEVAAFDPMPFNGLYSVTKTALDAYAQALRQELNLIGQKVITVRPGAVETNLSTESMKATQNLADTTVLYRKQARNFAGLAAKFMGTPIKPEVLAALIYKATTAKHPKLIYRKHQNIGLVLLNTLPKRSQCAVIKLLLRLNLF